MPVPTMAQTETILHSYWPHRNAVAAPLEDKAGALYVPTYSGAAWGSVTAVFDDRGVWRKRTIFGFDGTDGENPSGALIQAPDGTLYGLTNFGGTHGYGTVYSLNRDGHPWNEAVLYNFIGGPDGGQPRGSLMLDAGTGALYGTADGGGDSNCGTAYSLTRSGGGWNYAVIHTFAGGNNDGCFPAAGVHEGAKSGTLFGASAGGGSANDGTVFELRKSNGIWSESVLYAFAGASDGLYPGDIAVDHSSHVFGVAGGGANGAGVVYELSKAGTAWQFSVIYTFTGGADGAYPIGLTIDTATGTIFGTTQNGGSSDNGTLFRLVPEVNSWIESVVYSFGATKNDGSVPLSRPVEDTATGNLYGTTSAGGAHNGGTLYRIAP